MTRALLAPLVAAVVAGSAGVVAAPSAPAAAPAYRHVVLVMEENKDYPRIVGSPEAPYLNRLASTYGLATRYSSGYPTGWPSLPAYLMLLSGSTQGVTSDCAPRSCPVAGTNVFHQLAQAGQQWRVYAESEPFNCDPVGVVGNYAARHAPAPYFLDEATNCARWDVPLGTPSSGAFQRDLAAGALPALSLVTPDLRHDMHNGTVAQGDAWLANWVPKILAGRDYKRGDTLVVITFDEGSENTNHIATVVVSPTTTRVRDATPYTHCSLLRTVEDVLGVGRLGCAVSAQSMARGFGLG